MLPEEMGKLDNLKAFHLENNDIEHFPASLKNLKGKKIGKIFLQGNKNLIKRGDGVDTLGLEDLEDLFPDKVEYDRYRSHTGAISDRAEK